MTNDTKSDEVKPDPLEPLKATIRQYIAGKDLSKLPMHQAFHDLYVATVPTQMDFGLAWQGVMREGEPPEKTEEQGEPQINTDQHGSDETQRL